MDVVILAGGKGTRLRPYTHAFPKALVPIGEMPVLELIIRQLKHYGLTRITLAVGHLAELIKAYFGDGSKWGVELTYLLEETPLGTAGPLRTIAHSQTGLSEHFIVMNADVVCDLNFKALLEQQIENYQQTDSVATLALQQRTTQIEFGVVDFDTNSHTVQTFREKPTFTHHVSMGVNAFHRSVINVIPEGQLFGLDHLMRALQNNQKGIQAFPFEGYWLDIGRHGDYEAAMNEFDTMRARLLPGEVSTERLIAGRGRLIAGRWPQKVSQIQ